MANSKHKIERQKRTQLLADQILVPQGSFLQSITKTFEHTVSKVILELQGKNKEVIDNLNQVVREIDKDLDNDGLRIGDKSREAAFALREDLVEYLNACRKALNAADAMDDSLIHNIISNCVSKCGASINKHRANIETEAGVLNFVCRQINKAIFAINMFFGKEYCKPWSITKTDMGKDDVGSTFKSAVYKYQIQKNENDPSLKNHGNVEFDPSLDPIPRPKPRG